jgi:dethiobiotin synthase
VRRGLFVTGTDTGVGKTVVSAALLHRFRGAAPLQYWKPVQTGIERDDDTREVRRLGRCRRTEVLDEGVRLRRPLSPHLSARLAGRRLDVDAIAAPVSRRGGALIAEGAGGVLVPLNESVLTVDLIRRLDLPALVVARSRLGTINHTLLTLEALRTRGVEVAAVVMTGPPNPENRAAIEHFGRVAVAAELPVLRPLTAASLGRWARTRLDPEGLLLRYLR